MPLSVSLLLLIAAFICTILSTLSPSRCPLWVSVLLVEILLLLNYLPK